MRKSYLLLIAVLLTIFSTQSQETVYSHITKPTDAYPLYMPTADQYILKAKATTSDTTATIAGAYFRVNQGEKMYAGVYGDYYIAAWTPTFGFNDIEFTAISSTGESSTTMRTIEVTAIQNDVSVTSIKDLRVKFGGEGRTVYDTIDLPNHLGAFDSLHAVMTVNCPPGDCDPWDRVAWIDVKGPDGTWIELIRYITPYGVSCTHEIDLTDYLFLLEGEVEFRVFVDTWAGSWEFTLDLEYFSGTPEFKYGTVAAVYDGVYQFGDYANLFPFDTVSYEFNGLTQSAKYNILLSGHGWGAANTGNAAEFYPAVHEVILDNVSIPQATIRDCNPNPDGCTGQLGTWQFDRSGWCPGAITHPFEYDLNAYIGAGKVSIYYEFDNNYVDLCHPNHPNCVSGVTCVDCNEGFNPHYYIGANVFSYNNIEPFERRSVPVGIRTPVSNSWNVSIQPNPASEVARIGFGEIRNANIMVYDNLGKLVRKAGPNALSGQAFYDLDVRSLPAGVYYIQLSIGKEMVMEKLIVE